MKLFIAILVSAILIAPIAVWADAGKPQPPSANAVNNSAAMNQPVDPCKLASTSAVDIADQKTAPGDIYVDGMYAEACALGYRIPADGCDTFILAADDFAEAGIRYVSQGNANRARTSFGVADLEYDFASSVCEDQTKKSYAIRRGAATESFISRIDGAPAVKH